MRDAISRWSEIRLIVQRPIGEQAAFAILVRRVEGGVRRDSLVARGTVLVPPGSPESTSWLMALRAALESELT